MKKIIVIFILMIFSLGMYKYKVSLSSSKININVKEDEIALLLFKEQNNEYLYIKTKNEDILLPLMVYNDNIPYKILNKLGIREININEYKTNVVENNIIKNIDNFKINFSENKKEIKNNDFSFCIYENGNIPDCKYIYFLNETEIENESLELALYSDKIDEKFEKNLLEKWIDTYKISSNDITIIKLRKNDYNVLKVPEYYF